MDKFLVVLILVTSLWLSGCAPTRAVAYVAHQSTIGAGPHEWPIGDNDSTYETTYEGIGVGLEWEKGRAFWDMTVDYRIQSDWYEGSPWRAQFRAGIKVDL